MLSEKCTTLTFQTLSLHTMVASLGGLFKGRKTLFLGHLWPFYRTLPFRIFPHVEIQMTIVTHMYEAHNQQCILPFISKTPWTSCNLAVKSSGLFLKFSLALIWAWAQCLKEGRDTFQSIGGKYKCLLSNVLQLKVPRQNKMKSKTKSKWHQDSEGG